MSAPFLELEPPARIFAIGDIHGCPEELHILLEHLRSDRGLGTQDLLVFIGDYIDRGFESRAVVELAIALKQEFPATVFLRGNHESMMLQFLGMDTGADYSWLQNGGTTTLKSYGVASNAAPEEIIAALPPAHINFLLGLERYLLVSDLAFVHAGFDPLRDVRTQLDQDIYWIRDPFINNIHRFERTVVFGHTPFKQVMFNLPYKIGIDTGLVYGNRLSCIEFPAREVLQVQRKKFKVESYKFPKS
ncbi:MAG: serine/threonine protein phosphatase [Oligoflexia bacterium]|nr:serine/threonine protein phosphatase [Oligoflexia bacterium]